MGIHLLSKTGEQIDTALGQAHDQDSDTDLGALSTKNPPIDADKAVYRDSTSSDALVTSTWAQVKAFLKTYFDTLYLGITHASNHTDGTDDIQSATNAQKGLATAAHITAIEANTSASHTQNTDTGTTSTTFQIDSGNTGPKLKNNSNVLEVRNNADDDYLPTKASSYKTGSYTLTIDETKSVSDKADKDTDAVAGNLLQAVSGGGYEDSGEALPSGALVGTTDTQTLSNKTLTDPALDGALKEEIYAISDGAAFEIDPSNGTIQTITLGASRTPKATNFANGESVTLLVNDGSDYTLTWTDATLDVEWKTDSGSAPTLNTTGYTVIVLFKAGDQIYGFRSGDD